MPTRYLDAASDITAKTATIVTIVKASAPWALYRDRQPNMSARPAQSNAAASNVQAPNLKNTQALTGWM